MVIKNNRGSVTLEATLILPIFIFAILGFFHMCRLKMAEGVLFEATVETVEYMAEYSYLTEGDGLLASAKIRQYIDDEDLVSSYIIGGVDGVNFSGSQYLDEEEYVCLHVNYQVEISIPLLGSFSGDREYVVRQRAYVGEEKDQEGDGSEEKVEYVYVTDNREAYHTNRGCSHLTLEINFTSKEQAKTHGYSACQFCKDTSEGGVYITKWGDRFHSMRDCSGLKRTVYRIKKSEVEGLGACLRCGY